MVPISVRGKKWNEVETMMGAGGFATYYYEHVIITEQIFGPDVLDKKPSASVLFKEKACGWKSDQDPFDKPFLAAPLHNYKK